jgi:hypothetical protein
LFCFRTDQPFEDDKDLFEWVLADHQLADIICKFFHGPTVEYISITDLLEYVNKLRNDGILLCHVGDEVVILYLYIWIELLSLHATDVLDYKQV